MAKTENTKFKWLKKNWVWLVVGVIAIVIIYKIYNSYDLSTGGGAFDYTQDPETLDTEKLLKIGDSGKEVTELQTLINKAYILNSMPEKVILVDGNFGPATQNALVELMNVSQVKLADAQKYFDFVFNP